MGWGGFSVNIQMGRLPARLVMERANPRLVRQAATEAVNLAGPFVVQALARNTPDGATGKARQSVMYEPAIFSPTPRGFVGYGAPASLYIGFVDSGTRPHTPPTAPLVLWAYYKFGDPRVGYLVAKSIARRGTKPQHFLARTTFAVRGRVISMMRDYILESVRNGLTKAG